MTDASVDPVVGRELRKTFRRETGDIIAALDGVSFSANRGSLTAIVGPDGAGKTTLLRLTCGLMQPDGGSIDQIYTTITHGVRASDPQTHFNLMPNFGADGILTPDQIVTVAKQVASLSGLEGGVSTPEGQKIFADNCAACHGAQGQGDQSLGAPALNDKIWLYGGSVAQIEAQVTRPRHGVMPAWGARLGDTAVKELAVYVHGLGGGQ